MTSQSGKRSRQRSGQSAGRTCRSCGAGVPADARFCPACGAPPDASPGTRGRGRAVAVSGFAAGILGVSLLTGAVFHVLQQPAGEAPAAAPAATPPAATAPSGTPPDLSTMSPREAADRLFNRVMAASEQGRDDEARRFAPMAVQAYGNLPALDLDARYHLGLMNLIVGDLAAVAAQIAAMRQEAPNHLLALVLQHDVALRTGDAALAERALAEFRTAYAGEIATDRAEYTAHRNVIDALRVTPGTPMAGGPPASVPAAGTPAAAETADGATLFALNCALCHGVGAVGSDMGPPLVHRFYEPGHHDDDAIRRAIRQGVTPHHWTFGPMPPVPGISDEGVERIIGHIRALQRAAGIE